MHTNHKLQQKLTSFKQKKDMGAREYIFTISVAFVLGSAFTSLFIKDLHWLLSWWPLCILFFMTLVIRYLSWKDLDRHIATIEESINTGQELKLRKNQSICFFLLCMTILAIVFAFYKSKIDRFFYEKHMASDAIETYKITNDNDVSYTLHIPANYLQSLDAKLSPYFPNLTVSHHPRLSTRFSDLEPYFLTEEKEKILRMLKRMGGHPAFESGVFSDHFVTQYVELDQDYISISIVPKHRLITRTELLALYDKTFENGLQATQQISKYGLLIYKGKMPFISQARGTKKYRFLFDMSYMITQDEKDTTIQLMGCDDKVCIMIATLEDFNVLVAFHIVHLEQWRDLLTRINYKINSFKVN